MGSKKQNRKSLLRSPQVLCFQILYFLNNAYYHEQSQAIGLQITLLMLDQAIWLELRFPFPLF